MLSMMLLLSWLSAGPAYAGPGHISIRFDPGYIYQLVKGDPQKISNLKNAIKACVHYWKKNKISRVAILFNNPEYGAFFPTTIPFQPQEDTLGKSGLLKELIQTLHTQHIEVFAWFFPLRLKQAWLAKPLWRAPKCTAESKEENEYLLDVKIPEVQQWYHLLMTETLHEFPKLDGVDIAEPISVQDCSPADADRTRLLTAFFQNFEKSVLSMKIKLSLTPTFTTSENGHLWTFTDIEHHFGVDLPELLEKIHWTTFFPQLDFHQWQILYPHPKTFSEKWPHRAWLELRQMLKEKKVPTRPMGIHLELGGVSNQSLRSVMKSFDQASLWGFDLYDTHLAMKKKTDLRMEKHP